MYEPRIERVVFLPRAYLILGDPYAVSDTVLGRSVCRFPRPDDT
jgi:hypothetical protein